MIKNRKQLTGYAGCDVVQNQSGTSLNGRTRISKKGNSNIRSALHMLSFVYTLWETDSVYVEDFEKKNNNKLE